MKTLLPRRLLRWMRRCRELPQRFHEWPEQRRQLGTKSALQLGWSAFRYPIGARKDLAVPLNSVIVPGLPFPFWFRDGTSDLLVISQIFVRREYELVAKLKNVRTIVDLGANIGGAAVFFLNLFPLARVIAVEPSIENIAVLERNLAPYRERATLVRAAVWPNETALNIVHGQFRDGLDWSTQVSPSDERTDSTVRGMPMRQLASEQDIESFDLLKIDIEGAERELFLGDTDWLRDVRNFCIELHDEDCRLATMNALRPYRFLVETREETTLIQDLQRR